MAASACGCGAHGLGGQVGNASGTRPAFNIMPIFDYQGWHLQARLNLRSWIPSWKWQKASSLRNGNAPAFSVNFSTLSALSTAIPRTKSTTTHFAWCNGMVTEKGLGCILALAFQALGHCLLTLGPFRHPAQSSLCASVFLLAQPLLSAFIFFLVARVTSKGPGRSKFAQLVSNHVFGDKHGDEFVAVVNCQGVSHKLRRDHRPSCPGLDGPLLTRSVHLVNLSGQALGQ
jgi:hypothetical protein